MRVEIRREALGRGRGAVAACRWAQRLRALVRRDPRSLVSLRRMRRIAGRYNDSNVVIRSWTTLFSWFSY